MFLGLILILLAWYVEMPLWLSITATLVGSGRFILGCLSNLIKTTVNFIGD